MSEKHTGFRPIRITGEYMAHALRADKDPLELAAKCMPEMTVSQLAAILANRATLTGNSVDGVEYVEDVDVADDQCPECARSRGPHYRGPCSH